MAINGKAEVMVYLRTSSATNVGQDKESAKRQRAAVAAYAKRAGCRIVGEFYDEAVRGADAIDKRPGFAAMMEAIAANGCRTTWSRRQVALLAISWSRRSATRCSRIAASR